MPSHEVILKRDCKDIDYALGACIRPLYRTARHYRENNRSH